MRKHHSISINLDRFLSVAKKKDKKAKTPKEGVEAKPAGKGGLVMGLVTAAALGGASFGTVFMLPDRAQSAPAPIHHETAHKDGKGSHLPTIEDLNFVELEPLTISLGKKSRLLKIGITLETTGIEIDSDDPQIRDTFTSYLRALKIDQIEDPTYMASMRAQLVHRAQLIKGEDKVHGVLITEFLLR